MTFIKIGSRVKFKDKAFDTLERAYAFDYLLHNTKCENDIFVVVKADRDPIDSATGIFVKCYKCNFSFETYWASRFKPTNVLITLKNTND